MNPHVIFENMDDSLRKLTAKNEEYELLCTELAEAETEYEKKKNIVTLMLKGEHGSTVAQAISKGDEKVAPLLFNRDVKRAVVTACVQAMRILTTEIDVARSKLAWARQEMGRT